MPASYLAHVNADWHRSHKMPKHATADQRVEWHLAHAAACACRAVPAGVVALMRARGIAPPVKRRPATSRSR